MLNREDLFQISFYQKSPFFGSINNTLCFRIRKCIRPADDGSDHETPVLEVVSWPGPYNFETTPDEQKTVHYEEFSEEGLDRITGYLNALCA